MTTTTPSVQPLTVRAEIYLLTDTPGKTAGAHGADFPASAVQSDTFSVASTHYCQGPDGRRSTKTIYFSQETSAAFQAFLAGAYEANGRHHNWAIFVK